MFVVSTTTKTIIVSVSGSLFVVVADDDATVGVVDAVVNVAVVVALPDKEEENEE